MRRINCAVFGTSRSGKDYTIKDAIALLKEKGVEFTHLSPITMVHNELGGRRLKDMQAEDKAELVRFVRNSIRDQTENGCSFVDEHYCFPTYYGGKILEDGYNDEKLPFILGFDEEGNQYEIVFQPEWITSYDVAIYMDIDPEIILDRFRTSEGCKCNTDVTLDDIYCWKNYEIKQIQDLCHKVCVPLFYVYNPEKSGKELAGIITFFSRYSDDPDYRFDDKSIRKTTDLCEGFE